MRVYVRGNMQHPSDLVIIAQAAESAGLHGITLSDHVLMPESLRNSYPGTSDGVLPFPLTTPWPDAFVTAGAIAAVTKSLMIRTDVYILSLRHPLVVARAVNTLAALSRGRFELGVGVGWLESEFDVLGVDFHRRGALTDEAIAAVRSLTKPGPVSHDGKFYTTGGAIYVEPSWAQPVPIYIGGESQAALRRAAQLGDGYISMSRSLDELGRLAERLTKLCHEERPASAAPLRIHAYCTTLTSPEDFRDLAKIGVESVVMTPWSDMRSPPPGLAERIQNIEHFAASWEHL